MAKYFVKTATITGGSAPNDANDGLDPIGFGIADGTYNDATKTLTSTGAFTTYVYTAGDQVYIASGTNATPGLYTIASKVDADNITLTASAGSTDVTADWATSDGPWLTIQKASNTATAGDFTIICADGTHEPAANITYHLDRKGTAANPKRITGATGRGVIDGTKATIDGQNQSGAVFYDNSSTECFAFTRFQYLDLFGNAGGSGTQDGILLLVAHTNIQIIDCIVRSMGQNGIHFDNATITGTILRCDIYGNEQDGIGCNQQGDGRVDIRDCSVHDNGSFGIQCGRTWIDGCVVYDNGSTGIENFLTTVWGQFRVTNSTIQANDGDGIRVENTTAAVLLTIVNNIISENGGYGINYDGNDQFPLQVGPNVFDNNTSGATSIDGLADAGATGLDENNTVASQELDPVFASIIDGSENLIPIARNAAFAAGEQGIVPDGVTIDANRRPYCGAVPPDLTSGGDGAGGGGFVIGG